MKFRTLIITVILGALPVHASAWTALNHGLDCKFEQTFEGSGSSTLTFLSGDLNRELGTFAIGDLNNNWSIPGYEILNKFQSISDLKVLIDGHILTNDIFSFTHGVGWFFPESDLESLKTAKTFVIMKGDQVIDRLNISDATANINEFQACIASNRANYEAALAEKRRKEAVASLPVDPFAKSEK